MNRTKPNYFDRMLAEVYPSALKLAAKMVNNRDDAGDLVGKAIENALRARQGYRYSDRYEIRLFRGWFFRIVRNVFIDEIRRRKSRRRDSSLDAPQVLENGEQVTYADMIADKRDLVRDTMDKESAREILAELKRRLPAEFFQTLVYDFNEYSYQEIADEMRVAIGTVRSRLHRGRKMSRKILQDANLVSL